LRVLDITLCAFYSLSTIRGERELSLILRGHAIRHPASCTQKTIFNKFRLIDSTALKRMQITNFHDDKELQCHIRGTRSTSFAFNDTGMKTAYFSFQSKTGIYNMV